MDAPDALREVLGPARIQDGTRRNDAVRRGGSPEMHPELVLERVAQASGHHRVRTGDPDHARGLVPNHRSLHLRRSHPGSNPRSLPSVTYRATHHPATAWPSTLRSGDKRAIAPEVCRACRYVE